MQQFVLDAHVPYGRSVGVERTSTICAVDFILLLAKASTATVVVYPCVYRETKTSSIHLLARVTSIFSLVHEAIFPFVLRVVENGRLELT